MVMFDGFGLIVDLQEVKPGRLAEKGRIETQCRIPFRRGISSVGLTGCNVARTSGENWFSGEIPSQ